MAAKIRVKVRTARTGKEAKAFYASKGISAEKLESLLTYKGLIVPRSCQAVQDAAKKMQEVIAIIDKAASKVPPEYAQLLKDSVRIDIESFVANMLSAGTQNEAIRRKAGLPELPEAMKKTEEDSEEFEL